MAAPITHIVLAKEFLQRNPTISNGTDFCIGASFPDIRYLGVITREATHASEVSLQSILNTPDAFSAGMKYHTLVDLVREKFIQDRDVYSSAPKSRYITQAIKLFEDEILYERLSDWNGIANLFESVLSQERSFPISTDDIDRWHNLLRDYVSRTPSTDSRKRFITNIGFTTAVADEIEQVVDSLKKNEIASSVVHDMYRDFTSLVH